MDSGKTKGENLKLIFDFQFKSIWELIGLLSKEMTFYLIIMTALTGYIVSDKIELDVKRSLIIIGIIINIFSLTAGLVLLTAIMKGISSLKTTLIKSDSESFFIMNLNAFFKGGKIVSYIISGICALTITVITVYYFILFNAS